MKHFSAFVCILLLSTLFGCGNKQPLGGRVTYSDDGSPVIEGYVVFTTATFQSRGKINPDGYYKMSSTGNNDGIPPDKYRVYLGGTEEVIVTKNNDGSIASTKYIPRVAEKFASPDSSGLNFTVDGTTKTFDIIVDRVKK
jgi:hypothetical protein